MGKGTKIFIKLISTILLLLLVVPIILSLLLDIGAVQNYVVKKAAQFVSEKIETTVSIDHIDFGLFNRVKIKGFYVEDYQRDTLLYVGDLDAHLAGLGLLGGGLKFHSAVASNVKFYMRESPSGELNVREIIDKINGKDRVSSGNFKLQIAAASLHNVDICIERGERRLPAYGVDYSDIHLHDINGSINNFKLSGVAITAEIYNMSAREMSGFVLKNFAGNLYVNSGCVGFSDASIATAKSNIEISHISLVGNSWEEYKDFVANILFDASIKKSVISSDDVAYFAPSMRDWGVVVRNLGLDFTGTVDNLEGQLTSLEAGQATSLVAGIKIKGLPDIKNTIFDLNIKRLSSEGRDIEFLARRVGGVEMADNLVGLLDNAKIVTLNGVFNGLLSSFNFDAELNSEIGSAKFDLHVMPSEQNHYTVDGSVIADNIELGQLLNREDLLGVISFETDVNGLLGGDLANITIASTLSKLEFNNYQYSSIKLDGQLFNRQFNGAISARDNAVDFDFSGLIDFNGDLPKYDFLMSLHKANLIAMNINRRDSISELKATIRAEASGLSLDDISGVINVKDVVYIYNNKSVAYENITINGDNSKDVKFIELTSDFADATFRSKESYSDVIEYLKSSLSSYLPALSDDVDEVDKRNRAITTVNDYSLFSLDIKDINPVMDAIASGLQVAKGSQVKLLFNPVDDNLSLQLTSDYIERDKILATRLSINIGNRVDSLTMYASAEDIYFGGVHLPDFSVMGGAKHGEATLSAGFADTLTQSSGLISILAKTAKREGADGQFLNVKFMPSHYTKKNALWQIFSKDIKIDTDRVDIEEFVIMNKEQRLVLEGVASKSVDDSLTLNLYNFDISPLSKVIDAFGYNIEGVTNGAARIKSAFNKGELSANIVVDSLKVNGIEVPSLLFESKWDFKRNRAGVVVTNRQKLDTLVRGYYEPSTIRYYADVDIDSLDVTLLDPILSGVISNTKGFALVDLNIQGLGREAKLNGEIKVSKFETMVDYTNVKYYLSDAVIGVNDNVLKISKAPMRDVDGNSAFFDMSLNLNHLSNVSYNITVAPDNMLVMNTTDRENSLFYGKVYASGIANISGDKRGVNMDITAASEDNSHFYMPLLGKSNISTADFITFKQPEVESGSDDYLEQKKSLFVRRRRNRTESGGGVNVTLNLEVRPNLDFQLMIDPSTGNVIRGRGTGDLTLNINPKTNTFEMFGDYTISEGVYLFSLPNFNFIQKKFVIEEGSTIQWTGSPLDALLNIDVVYKVKASLQPLLQGSSSLGGENRSVPVDCYIYLRDRLTAPNVSFDVKVLSADSEIQTIVANELNTPETIDTQFLYLVVFNSFLADASSSFDAGTASAATGFEFLANQLSNLLSADDYNIVLRYRPKSKITSEEVDFGLSKSLINNRLFVELEGNYVEDKQSVNDDVSPFGGEAYVTWLIDRAGTLRLRGFTQTINRFDENQGLQETGIGIYFKEDFKDFKDLRQRIKSRFTNKKRKSIREIKRLERKEEKKRKKEDTSRRESAENELGRGEQKDDTRKKRRNSA